MSPTISDETIRKEIPKTVGIDEDDNFEKNVQNAEQRAKRKVTCDNELKDFNRKRKRKCAEKDLLSLSSSSSTTSSLTLNSDEYGTDSELIAIDCNKANKSSWYFALNDCSKVTKENEKTINICSEHLCTQNSKSHDNSTKSKNSSMRVDDIISKITTISKISNSNASTNILLEIAIATLKLIKKNREFQRKLTELSSDTTNLLNSVLDNPENHLMKERFKLSVL